jgi:hypothetical protein
MTRLEEITKILQGKEGSKVLFKHKSANNFERGVFVGFSNFPDWAKGWITLIRRESKNDLIIGEVILEPEYVDKKSDFFKIEYTSHYGLELDITPKDKNYQKYNELLKSKKF